MSGPKNGIQKDFSGFHIIIFKLWKTVLNNLNDPSA